MKLKFYRHKPRLIRAIQYDGTDYCREMLLRELKGIEMDDNHFCFTYYGYEGIYNGDWLVVEKDTVVEVIERDYFADNYEEYKG